MPLNTRPLSRAGTSDVASGSGPGRKLLVWLWLLFIAAPPSAIAAGAEAAKLPPTKPLQGAILVLLDTARADHMTPYGHRRNTTPGLRDLAERGVLFEQVVSYSPWTLPSVAAMLAGDRFSRGYDVAQGKLRHSLVEEIQSGGYTTAAITEGGFVSAHFGFDRGFDEFREGRSRVVLQVDLPGETGPQHESTGVERTFSLAAQWLREHAEERFFLLIHTYEPHTPYGRRFFTKDVPRGKLKRVFDGSMLNRIRSGDVEIGKRERRYASALYDGGLRKADSEFATLMNVLDQIGLSDRTLVVVTSDHGEELGEHYPQYLGDHGHALFDEQLLVPLVIADPTHSYPLSRVSTQVRSIDILPTVAELLAVPLPRALEGRSLVPLMRGLEREDRVAFGGVTKLTPARQFVRDGKYKYIESSPRDEPPELSPAPPLVQLYDLVADPSERVNLADDQPERVRHYHKQLVDYLLNEQNSLTLDSATETVDPALREQLRALGYLE